jgi:hypothetical protein|uniref:Uncharacterized protein n=1 Tax=Podoviridae sp. ctC8s18 TaxID=2827617 RepID=A0A8S5LR40_9CAUD|nr:MAG TPA: hypothetical protein [Podoviridae sp. ctC8s18]
MKKDFEVFKLTGKDTVEQVIKDLREQSDILYGMDDEEAYEHVSEAMKEGSIDTNYSAFLDGGTIITITL